MPARTTPLQRKAADSAPKEAKRKIKDPRRRLLRVIEILESNLGRAAWDGQRDGLEVLILTILSQNTTDPNALRGYIRLCEAYPRDDVGEIMRDGSKIPRLEDGSVDPVAIRLSQVSDAFFSPDWRKIAAAPLADVKEAVRPAGLPNSKAPAIQAVIDWVAERSDALKLEEALAGMSDVEAVEALSTIKGVGLKTITVTLLEAWGADLCPVDTHVHRVIQRLQVVQATNSRDRTFHLLAAVLPEGSGFALHHNLLTFGRTVCKAKSPQCAACYLAALCPSREDKD